MEILDLELWLGLIAKLLKGEALKLAHDHSLEPDRDCDGACDVPRGRVACVPPFRLHHDVIRRHRRSRIRSGRNNIIAAAQFVSIRNIGTSSVQLLAPDTRERKTLRRGVRRPPVAGEGCSTPR